MAALLERTYLIPNGVLQRFVRFGLANFPNHNAVLYNTTTSLNSRFTSWPTPPSTTSTTLSPSCSKTTAYSSPALAPKALRTPRNTASRYSSRRAPWVNHAAVVLDQQHQNGLWIGDTTNTTMLRSSAAKVSVMGAVSTTHWQ
jgi:hypothetical protein